MNTPQHDIVIMGGGLAGLTLALQLRQRLPDLDVLILERRQHPVPEAAFKIGESTVEIGAHYFENVLGLRSHLMEKQLKKFGFRFFWSEGREDLERSEAGAGDEPHALSMIAVEQVSRTSPRSQRCAGSAPSSTKRPCSRHLDICTNWRNV